MTDNPRSTLLRRARRRTAAIVIGTLAGTGLLTVGIAAAQGAFGDEPVHQRRPGGRPGDRDERRSGRAGVTTTRTTTRTASSDAASSTARAAPTAGATRHERHHAWQDWSCLVRRDPVETARDADLARGRPASSVT